MKTILPALLLVAACSGPPPAATATPGIYVITYASRFVGAMRQAGLAAGAFEVSKKPQADGLYHLDVELHPEGAPTQKLKVRLRGAASHLELQRADLDAKVVYPANDDLGNKLAECHRRADAAARAELEGGSAPGR